MTPKPIRVLIVDDSALARKAITNSLAPFTDIEVIGTAADPYAARDMILELNPDVITLDIEMPRMDGITFLKILMKHRPMPVIIMSSLSPTGSQKALDALQSGAVDVMDKPGSAVTAHTEGNRLAEKIRVAAVARICPGQETRTFKKPLSARSGAPAPVNEGNREIILLGASTGGTVALKEVLSSMRGDLPGICIVQHMPGQFSKAFAERLNDVCKMVVREAVHGDVISRGLALVAPGGFHLMVKWQGNKYVAELSEGPAVHHQRPSVDVLFDSAVKAGAGAYASAALLTGMGSDGASGLLNLRQNGAATIAQNEDTCVVFGMPREAIRLGAPQEIIPLNEIGPRLEELSNMRAQPQFAGK